MNNTIQNFDKEIVEIEITGGKIFKGAIIDFSSDIIVLFDGLNFLYISLDHILQLTVDCTNENNITGPTEPPSIISKENKNTLSVANVLSQAQAQEMYIEIFVSNNQSLYGYVLSIQDDYFVFQSPIYKTIIVATKHLKWLIPHDQQLLPYGLTEDEFCLQSNNPVLLPTLEAQVKKMKNELVVFNLSYKNNHIGKINNVKGYIVELQTASGEPTYFNIQHIKTIYKV